MENEIITTTPEITDINEMIALMGALSMIAEASQTRAHAEKAQEAWERFQRNGLEQLVEKSSENFTNQETVDAAIAFIEQKLVKPMFTVH